MNRSQFEELRRWGDALRRDEREELRAAGEGIRRLCLEIDRLGRELSAARAAAAPEPVEDAEDTLSENGDQMEGSLRERLRGRLSALHR